MWDVGRGAGGGEKKRSSRGDAEGAEVVAVGAPEWCYRGGFGRYCAVRRGFWRWGVSPLVTPDLILGPAGPAPIGRERGRRVAPEG